MVLDADALHILAADIKDAVDVRVEKLRSIIVRDRLDLAVVQHEGRLEQSLAVAGGAACDNFCIGRHQGINFPDGADGCLERRSVVA